MGTTASKENIEKRGANIIDLNRQISNLNKRLTNETEKTISEIQRRKYDNETEICKRIVWENVDELSLFLPSVTVPVNTALGQTNMRFKPGISPPPKITDYLDQKINKGARCQQISRLYKYKVDMLKRLLGEIKSCETMKDERYRDLAERISDFYKTGQASEIDNQKWLNTYNILVKINKDTISNYNRALTQLGNIRRSKSEKDIENYYTAIIKTLADNTRLCGLHKQYFSQELKVVGMRETFEKYGPQKLPRLGEDVESSQLPPQPTEHFERLMEINK